MRYHILIGLSPDKLDLCQYFARKFNFQVSNNLTLDNKVRISKDCPIGEDGPEDAMRDMPCE